MDFADPYIGHFSGEINCDNHSFHGHITVIIFISLWRLYHGSYFLLFMNAQVFVSAPNPQKMTLLGNYHIIAPIKAQKGSKGTILNILGTAIFSYKMDIMEKCIFVGLDEVEVKL